MPDLFQLFDGSMAAGGSSAVSSQDGSSFSDVSAENDLVSRLASGSDSVELLVDYSDFANFVTFNSAESYVNVTAEAILNRYPIDGTVDDVQAFLDGLDGYQRYFLGGWPDWSGRLTFDPSVSSSYVSFTDFGVQDGVGRSSFVSPGTGSMSVQGWFQAPKLTGSSDVSVIFQKLRQGTADGLTVYLTGSQVLFNVSSGSVSVSTSGTFSPGTVTFFAAVLDRGAPTGTVSLYTATTGTFPALADRGTGVFGARFDLASGSFYIASGSVAGATVRPFTGSLDDVTVWATARTPADLTGSFNRRTYSQSGLVAAWDFDDASPASSADFGAVIRDSSGHRLDGRVQSFYSGMRGSGSLFPGSPAIPLVTLSDPDVVSYVVNAQVTGNLYDRSNPSLIFKLFPGAFSVQDQASTDVFENFALILARHFDRIKLYVSQLVNLRRVEYGDFDQAPDELLEHVAAFMGWELGGSFANADALRYLLGRNVQAGTAANVSLDTQLDSIKSQLWRRALLNLMYVYKTKGTRESVEALMRSYGIDNGFVRLKEYARKAETRIPVERVTAQKSVYALKFVSGSTVSFVAR